LCFKRGQDHLETPNDLIQRSYLGEKIGGALQKKERRGSQRNRKMRHYPTKKRENNGIGDAFGGGGCSGAVRKPDIEKKATEAQ